MTPLFFFRASNTTHKSLQTKVYFKPTDTYALLHKSSYHPKHTFKGIIKSQLIRYHCISSNIQDFHASTSILFHSLRSRGYSKRFLRSLKNSTLASLAPARSPPHTSSPPQVPKCEPSQHPSTYSNQGLYPSPSPHPDPNPLPTPSPNPNRFPSPILAP